VFEKLLQWAKELQVSKEDINLVPRGYVPIFRAARNDSELVAIPESRDKNEFLVALQEYELDGARLETFYKQLETFMATKRWVLRKSVELELSGSDIEKAYEAKRLACTSEVAPTSDKELFLRAVCFEGVYALEEFLVSRQAFPVDAENWVYTSPQDFDSDKALAPRGVCCSYIRVLRNYE